MFYRNYPLDQKPMKRKEYTSKGAFLNAIWRIFSVRGGGSRKSVKSFPPKLFSAKGKGGGGYPRFRRKTGMFGSKTTNFSPV